jgi:hypothetical protein
MTELRKLYLYDSVTGNEIGIDDSTGTIQTIDYEHHEVHSGSHFFVVSYADLSINEVLQFTWQMPNTTKWCHWKFKLDTESETLWQVYEGGSITNALANAVTPLNSNRNSGTASGTTMRYEVHANTAAADTDVTPTTLIMSGISGAGRNSGNDEQPHELVLKQNELYVLRATANAAGYIDFNMQWYEHTNEA